MHVTVMICYGLTIWFGMLLLSALAGEHFTTVLLGGPLIVSGAVVFVGGLDWLICRVLEKGGARQPAE
jgi:hypothetical protein